MGGALICVKLRVRRLGWFAHAMRRNEGYINASSNGVGSNLGQNEKEDQNNFEANMRETNAHDKKVRSRYVIHEYKRKSDGDRKSTGE